MARIPVISQRVSLQGGGFVPQVAPGAGAVIAGAFQGAAQGLGELQRTLEERAREDAAIFANSAANETRLTYLKRFQELSETAEPGATGFTDKLLEEYDNYADRVLEGAPELARKQLTVSLSNFRASLGSDAIGFEAKSRADKVANDFQTGLNVARNSLVSRPDLFDQTIIDQEMTIGALRLPEGVKAELLGDARAGLARSAAQGLIEQNPYAARDDLVAGRFDQFIKPDDKASLLNGAQSEIKRREAEAKRAALEARAILQGDAKAAFMDEIEAASQGQVAIPEIESKLRTAFEPDKAQAMLEQIDRSRALYAAGQEIALASPEEEAALLARFTPEGEGFAIEAKEHDALRRAIIEKRNALATDSAGYVMRHSPEVRAKFAAANDAPSMRRALSAMDEALEGLRVPPHARRAIPKEQAAEHAKAVNAAKGQEKANVLANLSELYGDDFLRVQAEIEDAGLGAGASTLAGMTAIDQRVARVDMAEALDRQSEVEKLLPNDTKRDIKEQVSNSLADFGRTVSPSALLETQASVIALANLYALNGEDAKTAADRAAQAVVHSQYNFAESYRVPAVYDLAAVENGAGLAIEGVGALNVIPPESLDERVQNDPELQAALREQYVSFLQSGARWVNAGGDHSGLVLVDHLNRPVIIDGRAYVLSFSELQRMGVAEATGVGQMVAP